jgi:predicted ATPase
VVREIVPNAAALSGEVLDEIVERTDGVPLFIEELTKAVLENAAVVGDIPTASAKVPATLHASLSARLDRLGPAAKEIAQNGAAIGREFSYELLAAIAQRKMADVEDALGRLVEAGLVFQRGFPPEATFLSKHALVQDTAYSMLLRGPRQALHARIGRALEERFPASAQPQILAHHFTQAGLLDKAVAYWSRAGQQSMQKSALVEAIARLRRGLRLIADLPETSERDQQELEMQIILADALGASRGRTHPDVAEVLARALHLVLATGAAGTTRHFQVLYGLWLGDYFGSRPRPALERAKEFLSLAETQTDPGLVLAGQRLVSSALASAGDFRSAFSHIERAKAWLTTERHRMLVGSAIGVSALTNWSWAFWHRGYPDQARQAANQARERARRSGDIHTIAWALVATCQTALLARSVAEIGALASDAVAFAREHGREMFLRQALIFQGWALAKRGQFQAGVAEIREGLTATRAIRAHGFEPMFLCLLAEALAFTGDITGGLDALDGASLIGETSAKDGLTRSSIGCGASCCDDCRRHTGPRSRLAFARHWTLRANKARGGLNCVPPLAWPNS